MTALPSAFKGDARYVRQVYVDESAPERERRISKLLESRASVSAVRAVVKSTLDSCNPIILRTGKRMTRRNGDGRHLLHASGSDVFEVTVTETLKDRALHLLDAALTGLLAAGGKLGRLSPT
jgi:hypothetical protein